MKIAYISRTGNVEKFVQKTKYTNILEIVIGNETVNEDFVLITYTEGYGEIPDEIVQFLTTNAQYLRGVAASGDKRYWDAYAIAADDIASKYQVPILHKFEEDGTEEDVAIFMENLGKLT